MIFEEKTITVKNGKRVLFRSPTAEDAQEMIDYLEVTAGETDFLNCYPGERQITPDREAAYLENINRSPNDVMIVCTCDGKIAGNCQIVWSTREKMSHRGTVMIALLQPYWGMGIGTAMFQEMIRIGRENHLMQLELDFVEGNTRAQALYEKMGFKIVAERPNAIRLRDGRLLKEYSMILPL